VITDNQIRANIERIRDEKRAAAAPSAERELFGYPVVETPFSDEYLRAIAAGWGILDDERDEATSNQVEIDAMREEARQIREARRAKMTQAEREKEDLDEALFLLNWGDHADARTG
jgi:hypothetical protein